MDFPPADQPWLLSTLRELQDCKTLTTSIRERWLGVLSKETTLSNTVAWIEALHDMDIDWWHGRFAPAVEEVLSEVMYDQCSQRVRLDLVMSIDHLKSICAEDISKELSIVADGVLLAMPADATRLSAVEEWFEWLRTKAPNYSSEISEDIVGCLDNVVRVASITDVGKAETIVGVIRDKCATIFTQMGRNIDSFTSAFVTPTELSTPFFCDTDSLDRIGHIPHLRCGKSTAVPIQILSGCGEAKIPGASSPIRDEIVASGYSAAIDKRAFENKVSTWCWADDQDLNSVVYLPLFFREELQRMVAHVHEGAGETRDYAIRLKRCTTDSGNLKVLLVAAEWDAIRLKRRGRNLSISESLCATLALIVTMFHDSYWLHDNEDLETAAKTVREIGDYFRSTLMKKTDQELGIGLTSDTADRELSRTALCGGLERVKSRFNELSSALFKFNWKPGKPKSAEWKATMKEIVKRRRLSKDVN